MLENFFVKAGNEYSNRINKEHLETIYMKYWKPEREQRKRSFLRMFWEKADFDDTDNFSAFRKRQKDKMKTRRKMKIEIDSYKRMMDIRKESVQVLQIIRDCYMRDHLKKNLFIANHKKFEMQAFEKGIAGFKPPPAKELTTLKLTNTDQVIKFHVNKNRDMPENFNPHEESIVHSTTIAPSNEQSVSFLIIPIVRHRLESGTVGKAASETG